MPCSLCANKMIALYLKLLRWMTCLGIGLWFFLMPLLPVYGFLRPWPEATSVIRAAGIDGTLCLIGISHETKMRTPGHAKGVSQRTYLSIPESLLTGKVFVVTQNLPSLPPYSGLELTVSRIPPVIVLLWLSAGAFLLWVACRARACHKPLPPRSLDAPA